MGKFGKRKKGLQLSRTKVTTYLNNKDPCIQTAESPFSKKLKLSPSVKTSTPLKFEIELRHQLPVKISSTQVSILKSMM